MRSKLLATAIVVAALGLATSAFATTSSGSGDDGHSYNLSFGGTSFSLLSFYGGSWGDYSHVITNVLNTFRSGRLYGSFYGGSWYPKAPRDAGYVPEPGALGVFSVGLLMAGALIRRFGAKR